MGDEELFDRLERLGLSDTEIATYLAILRHGEAKPNQIAAETDISKRHIYSVSEQLEEKNFVEVRNHATPTTVRAYPPEEVIERLQEDIQSIHSELTELYNNPEPTAEEITVVKSKVTILARMNEQIERATEEVVLSLPFAYLDEVEASLRDAVDRGVLVVLIVTEDGKDVERLRELATVARAGEEVIPTILVVDSKMGVFAPSELLLRSNADRRAIVFVQEQLGPVIVGSFLGNYWPLTEEVVVAEPTSLPATFGGFRHAVLQATLHKRRGTRLQAEVTGRWTNKQNGQMTLSGEVVDLRQGLLRPTNNEFPVEHSLVIQNNGERITVGGHGAFVEDIEADTVTLSEH